MKQSSELLVTFLLNATWQIALIAGAASVASWLLRQWAAKLRHVLWTTALVLSLGVPFLAASSGVIEGLLINNTQVRNSADLGQIPPLDRSFPPVLASNQTTISPSFQLSSAIAFVLIAGYVALLGFRFIRLLQAWRFAQQVRRSGQEVFHNEQINMVISRCEHTFGRRRKPVIVLSSDSIQSPVTCGVLQPVIILPEGLLNDQNFELLTSAIGHEYIHVVRRDYFFNLIYEFLYVFISFHPGAALIRRSIKQTRELCCDELVARAIITPEAYARSLVKLASSTPTLRRLSVSTTVGIADADILEARIMSLLTKRRTDARWKRVAVLAVSLLLVVPCVAAAAFAVHFELGSAGNTSVQDPVVIEKEKQKEKEKENLKREIEEVQFRLAQLAKQPVSQDQMELRERETEKLKVRALYLQKRLSSEAEEMRAYPFEEEKEAQERHVEEELKAIRINQATLGRIARIQMDQAIQIATSQYPGKVLSSTLQAEHWVEPGKLSADGRVFYHIIVLPNDETSQEITHVMVNAVDGTIIKAEKELPRKLRRREPPE